MFASACAVARAYPLFSRKTSSSPSQTSDATVRVEFLLVPSSECEGAAESNRSVEEKLTLSSEDLQCLESACTGVQLAARIVDAPCNEMNVDRFLQVSDCTTQHLTFIFQAFMNPTCIDDMRHCYKHLF